MRDISITYNYELYDDVILERVMKFLDKLTLFFRIKLLNNEYYYFATINNISIYICFNYKDTNLYVAFRIKIIVKNTDLILT